MFGTMGVTELILILAIVLIVFGAGKLPKIEGLKVIGVASIHDALHAVLLPANQTKEE